MALTLPSKYAADATLLVESAQIPGRLAESTVQNRAEEQLQIIQQRLMTRANLIDVANKFRVFPDRRKMSPDDIVKAMRSQTRIRTLGGRDRATVMTISFTSESAKVSADVVNEFVTLVLAEDSDIRKARSGQTLEFFVQQVARLDKELSKQSAEIVAFKEANKNALPEGLTYRQNREATLQERLNLAARDRASLVDQRDRLLAVGAAAAAQPIPLTPEQQQLATLNAQLVEWESVLSGSNPRVKVLKAKIAELEKRIEKLDETSPTSTASVLELQLAEIESRIGFIDEEITRTETELLALRKAIEATPAVSIRLDELEREYDNTQTLYNQAVADRAAAATGDQIEINAKGERVTVVEQAVPPSRPNSPNRKLIAGGGAFAGTALAMVFFALTELIGRSIRRPVDLSRGLNIQPLATIPYLEDASTVRRRRALKTILVTSVLLAIPIGLWAVHTFVLPLELVVEKVLDRVGL